MNNKLNNMINDFLANTDAKDEKELNEKLQEFILKMNNDEIEYENTPLDDAYEMLEKAENAKSKSQAIKYAKEAYKISPACFDAILFQASLEDDLDKMWELLDTGLKKEEERLKREGFFDKENIGIFYGMFETRPYIRGLYNKIQFLTAQGKIKQARDVCKEILRLNNNDNMGIRYTLMAIYAFLEEENEMLELYKKYKEDNLEMLLPLFVLYYKKGDDKKALKYLEKINDANPSYVKYYKGNIKLEDDSLDGCYRKGEPSEVFVCIDNDRFLLDTVPMICDYVLMNSKKKDK